MLIQTLITLFRRDLEKLKKEIASYEQEKNIWAVEGNIKNSAGNLCLHLAGNLNTYIGNEIGKTGYVRHREQEFLLKGISRADLVKKIDDTIDVVESALGTLEEDDLTREYPLIVFEEKTSVGYFLVHLSIHLGYHLGQINYHRRLLDK